MSRRAVPPTTHSVSESRPSLPTTTRSARSRSAVREMTSGNVFGDSSPNELEPRRDRSPSTHFPSRPLEHSFRVPPLGSIRSRPRRRPRGARVHRQDGQLARTVLAGEASSRIAARRAPRANRRWRPGSSSRHLTAGDRLAPGSWGLRTRSRSGFRRPTRPGAPPRRPPPRARPRPAWVRRFGVRCWTSAERRPGARRSGRWRRNGRRSLRRQATSLDLRPDPRTEDMHRGGQDPGAGG